MEINHHRELKTVAEQKDQLDGIDSIRSLIAIGTYILTYIGIRIFFASLFFSLEMLIDFPPLLTLTVPEPSLTTQQHYHRRLSCVNMSSVSSIQ